MRILKITKVSTFLVGIIMMAILLCFSSQVQAAQEGDYKYFVANGEAVISRYTGAGGAVTMPSTLGGYPVTETMRGGYGVAGAFEDCTGLTSITIPQGFKSIGDFAFAGCTGLTSITIPKSVTSIGAYGVFSRCTALTSITIAADNLEYMYIDGVIYDKTGTILRLFPFVARNSISIPQGVTIISGCAFYNCTGLTSITIPESVTSIDMAAFSGCTSLTSIRVNSATTTIYDRADTIPSETKIIGYDPSTAKDYALKYHNTFEVIGTTSDFSGMTEMKATEPLVGPNKVWTIKLNGLVNEASLNKIYVTNSQGVNQVTTCTVTTVNGLSQIKVNPTNNYTPGDYILWVKDIESVKGTKIKNQVYLKFTVQ